MMRSIGAVAAGFVVIGALSFGTDALVRSLVPGAYEVAGGTHDVGVLLLTQAYVGVYAVFGCWLAARLAGRQPMRHALVLGVLGLAFNVFAATQVWSQYPVWHSVLGLALVMPWAWLGGRIAAGRPAAAHAAA